MHTHKFGTRRYARAAVLVASALITIALFGSIAIGLTWDAGVQALV